jgi:hypothetical protein
MIRHPTKIHCSKCGKRCNPSKRYNDGICGICRGTHSRCVENRIYALRDTPEGTKYNAIECKKFPQGTVFVRRKASGVRHLFTVTGNKLVFTKRGQQKKVSDEKYVAFYEALKGCPEGWTKCFATKYWYGNNTRNIDCVLDALDSMGLMTSEDDGRIYAYTG